MLPDRPRFERSLRQQKPSDLMGFEQLVEVQVLVQTLSSPHNHAFAVAFACVPKEKSNLLSWILGCIGNLQRSYHSAVAAGDAHPWNRPTRITTKDPIKL